MQLRTRRGRAAAAVLLTGAAAVIAIALGAPPAGPLRSILSAAPARRGDHVRAVATVERRDFVRQLRLTGTVEAVESTTISAPRLEGSTANSLVVTRLVRAGSRVRAGDPIVEFDRQDQLKNALDRRAELQDLEQQIRKREAQERAAAAKDDSEIKQAESAMGRAELEMVKNDMIPRIEAEKNTQALEQARATLEQLRATYALKRQAAEADLQILRIRRDRAEHAMRQAERNASRMEITAPIEGMAVLKSIWKSNTMAEVQEGEEIRAGVPVVDIVNPDAMRVRARVNQADINGLAVHQPVRIGLDAYPDLGFTGRITQISPLGVTSTLSPKVRSFIVLIAVDGSHPNLMPDLTASLDVELERIPRALIIPRDALRHDGDRTYLHVQRGSGFEARPVGIEVMSAHEAVVASGVDEGAVVARHAAAGIRR